MSSSSSALSSPSFEVFCALPNASLMYVLSALLRLISRFLACFLAASVGLSSLPPLLVFILTQLLSLVSLYVY